jgi:hypothetical protein
LTNRLNDYWNNSPDRLLVQSKDNDNEYDWSDGLYNKNLSASLGFGLTPAFRMGLRTFGRIYGQGTYRSLPYILNFEGNNYQVDNSYFNNTSGMPADLKVKDLEFDITQLGGSAYFKLISGGFSWDIGGGMNFNKGRTKFKGAEFGNPNASLAYDETQNVLLPSKFPFGFTKIGFGRINRSSGFQFTFGVSAAKPTYEWNDIFKIYNDFGNGNSAIVPATNKEWRLGYSFGFDILF